MSTCIFCRSAKKVSVTLRVAVMLCLTFAAYAAASSYTVAITNYGANSVENMTCAAETAVSVTARGPSLINKPFFKGGSE